MSGNPEAVTGFLVRIACQLVHSDAQRGGVGETSLSREDIGVVKPHVERNARLMRYEEMNGEGGNWNSKSILRTECRGDEVLNKSRLGLRCDAQELTLLTSESDTRR